MMIVNLARWVLILTCAGCSEGAKLVQEAPAGGIVSYLYKEDRGVMFSRYRKEALEVMSKKCPSGYTILKEGESHGYSSVSGTVEGTEDNSRSRRWAMQFRCKKG